MGIQALGIRHWGIKTIGYADLTAFILNINRVSVSNSIVG